VRNWRDKETPTGRGAGSVQSAVPIFSAIYSPTVSVVIHGPFIAIPRWELGKFMKRDASNRIKAFITILGIVLLYAIPASAVYEHGHMALQIWDEEGQANAPAWVQAWLMVMRVSMLSGLLFVWRHVEARWVTAGVALGFFATQVAIPMLPIVKLSGLVALVHVIAWSPGLFFMLKNRPFLKGLSIYAVWSGLITLIIVFSFIFDVRDSVIYTHHLITRSAIP